MEQIPTPKKERKFLKAIVRVAGVLVQELALGLGRKYIGKMINKIKIPKKRETLSFLLLLSCTIAFAQYPATGNKQRLGYQTSGDGLVFRGRSNDTMALKPSSLNNAYHLFDTVNNVLFSYIKTKGGWQFNNSDTVIVNNNFSQPVDSLFFNVGVPTNNVDTAKMRWDSDLATVVLGLNDNVPNELGFKNFWLVKNQTGSTITKGSIVYANGTVGASGRITVAKFIANGSIDAKYLLGITAHDLSNGEDGYVISFGKIRKVNTDTFATGAILYPSPTTAGVWTDIEPVAPNIDMPIGFCINSHVNNGTISIRVASGYALHELHDLAISSPSANASLYYKSGLWRDTTAALLVSDTASMLTNYLRTGVAASTYTPLTRSISTTAPLQGGGDLSANRTFSITQASGSVNGFLSSTDWTTFNGKGNGTVTSVSGSGAISVATGTTTPVISIADAAFGTPGIVTSTGTQQFSGDKVFEGITQFNGRAVFKDYTYTATRLAGLSSTDRFATVGIGTGLSLTSGTLSATGGSGTVTSVSAGSPANGLSVATGTTTPVISMALAGSSTIGVVSATTQTFGGNKTFTGTIDVSSTGTFGGRVNTPWLERQYTYSTSSSFTVSVNTSWLDINTSVLTTLTLPSAATYPGKELHIRQSGTGQLQSASSNVIPFTSAPTGSTGTAILNPTNNKAVTLVSDGVNWIIMQRSTN
jgi:hypothetical protein